MNKILFAILSSVFAFSLNAKADDVLLTTTGGTYQLVTDVSEVVNDEIVVIASYSIPNGEVTPKVVVMGTASAEQGYFTSFFTDVDYSMSMPMPTTITLPEVNKENCAYEYLLTGKYTKSSKEYIALKNISNSYIKAGSGAHTLSLASELFGWMIRNNSGECPLLFDSRIFYCDAAPYEYVKDQTPTTYFYNAGGGLSTNSTYMYKKISTYAPPTATFTFGNSAFATMHYGENDVVLPEGMSAYTYSLEGNKLVVSHTFKAGEVVPYGTAVVVRGEPRHEYDMMLNPPTAVFEGVNLLKGSDEAVTTTGDVGDKFFMLSTGENGLGFYYGATGGAAFTSAAHKAYLCVPASELSSAKQISFELPMDDATMVNQQLAQQKKGRELRYDLSGRKTSAAGKVFIVDGKKYVNNKK